MNTTDTTDTTNPAAPRRRQPQLLTPPHSPVTFRSPDPGTTDPHWGCSRSWWNSKILPCASNGFKPPIRSIVDKKPAAVRGIRLIIFASAKAYFERLLRKQDEAVHLANERPKRHSDSIPETQNAQ